MFIRKRERESMYNKYKKNRIEIAKIHSIKKKIKKRKSTNEKKKEPDRLHT